MHWSLQCVDMPEDVVCHVERPAHDADSQSHLPIVAPLKGVAEWKGMATTVEHGLKGGKCSKC